MSPVAAEALHPILDTQSRYNRSTAGSWNEYAAHRAQIAHLLEPAGLGPAGRLCVLGAGNCNDLHLPSIAEAFNEVHLVDIDAEALDRAVARQEMDKSPRIHRHGGADLTGIAATLATWPQRRPSGQEIAACIDAARHAPAPLLPGPFDLALSPCLLSQIVGYAGDVLGREHPRYRDLLLAIRDRHLHMLVELTRPGGDGILVCDMLSSGSLADLITVRTGKLPDLMEKLSHTGQHFTGLAPSSVLAFFQRDMLTAPFLRHVRLLRPWIWSLAPLKKNFLVYAIRFRRSAGAVVLERPGG